MGIKVGLVGVGPVGDTIVRVLEERNFPMDGEPVFMATSERDEVLGGKVRHVQKINEGLFKNLNLVFFAGKEGSKGAGMQWGDTAVRNGCVVIDNGGDFRMYQIFPWSYRSQHAGKGEYICNPNCQQFN